MCLVRRVHINVDLTDLTVPRDEQINLLSVVNRKEAQRRVHMMLNFLLESMHFH